MIDAYYELRNQNTEMNNMTLDQAIAHAQEVAASKCDECGKEHAQLAAWLTKLQGYEDDTPLTEEFFERNGFEKRTFDFLYCDDVVEIVAQNIDRKAGIWRIEISYLDDGYPQTLDICTVGQLRMFLAIEGLNEIAQQFK